MSNPEHFLIIARPMRPVPMIGDGLAGDFIAKERQKRMPRRPLLFAHQSLALPHFARQHPHHEKRELGGRFGEHIGRVRERDFVFVGVGAVDVIESDGDLRHNLERPFPASKTSASIGSRSVVINASMPLFTFSMINFFGGASGPWKTFELVAALAQTVFRRIANARSGKDSFFRQVIVTEESNSGNLDQRRNSVLTCSGNQRPPAANLRFGQSESVVRLQDSFSPRCRRDRAPSRCSRSSWRR